MAVRWPLLMTSGVGGGVTHDRPAARKMVPPAITHGLVALRALLRITFELGEQQVILPKAVNAKVLAGKTLALKPRLF
jgi:hypothetical protein